MRTDKTKDPAGPPLSRFRVHGGTVYVSGQVPVRNGEVVSDDFEEQARETLENLRRTTLIADPPNPRVLVEVEATAALTKP